LSGAGGGGGGGSGGCCCLLAVLASSLYVFIAVPDAFSGVLASSELAFHSSCLPFAAVKVA
jgi:hypothetical protein